ncbi:hypothetical protein Tco_0058100 [Tanacetum coccineum]
MNSKKINPWLHFVCSTISFKSSLIGSTSWIMTEKLFAEYTGIKVKQFKETLLLHMGNVQKSVAQRTRHKRQHDRRMNERHMQSRESKVVSSKALDARLVVTQCSRTKSDEHITSSSLGTYITHVADTDIRLVNDQVPSAEVHLTAQHNVLSNEQQHIDQSEPSYDTYLLEKVDSNTTPDSTNMFQRGGEIDQDAEQDQVKGPLLKAEFLKMNDMVEKEVYYELSNRFLQLEKHCISLEISMQQKEESFQSDKPCKNQESPRFREFFEINDLKAQLQAKTTLICNLKNQIKSVKNASNEAKVKNDIDVIETINIELEHTLKNELRKLNRTSMDTKFAKPSILGKSVLQPHRNQSVVRQPNAFKSERPNFSKPWFTSQVGVITVLSKPVTPHYLLKVREYVLAKPYHVIAPGSSRNSQKEYYSSNDMAHNHYLEEARKKTQEKNRNSKPSVMPSVRLQNTANGSTPNPKRTSKTPRSLPTSKSSCISSGHRFSPKKTSAVYEKTSPRSCIRWKPTGKIFTTVGLKWIPTGMLFDSCTSKVDSEPPNGSNDDITNPYECNQTLNVSAGLALQRQMAFADNTSCLAPQRKERCTLQCALSLKEEESSYLRAVLSTTSINSHARLVKKWINYFKPPPNVDHPVPEVPTPVPAASTRSPSSTTIDQDAPSTSTSQTISEQQSSVIP